MVIRLLGQGLLWVLELLVVLVRLLELLLFLWRQGLQLILLIRLPCLAFLLPFLRMGLMVCYPILVLIYHWFLLSSILFLVELLTINHLFLHLMAFLVVVHLMLVVEVVVLQQVGVVGQLLHSFLLMV